MSTIHTAELQFMLNDELDEDQLAEVETRLEAGHARWISVHDGTVALVDQVDDVLLEIELSGLYFVVTDKFQREVNDTREAV